MFDDFKDNQKIVYSMLKNSIKLNKISHAYLIDSNKYEDIKDFINSMIKLLICPFGYSNRNNCGQCIRCDRIENGNDTEVRHIYPDGLTIKKEQLMELQENFNLSSIEGNRRVYVIWDCEKMNVQASNSILKFLEEPVSNIIAILVTSNVDALLSTIVSRCQYIKLNNYNMYSADSLVNVERLINSCGIRDVVDIDNVSNYVDIILNFVLYYEENKVDAIVYMKKLWHDNFKDRIMYVFAFQLIIQLYYDILKYKLRSELSFYSDYEVKVVRIANMLDIDTVVNRICIFIKYLEYVKYNLNLNLLMDSLIIELGE